jgi:hypothetical protein
MSESATTANQNQTHPERKPKGTSKPAQDKQAKIPPLINHYSKTTNQTINQQNQGN